MTSATVIRAGWALLLAQYSNTNDVVFGTALRGRILNVPQINKIHGVCTRLYARRTVYLLVFAPGAREATEMTPFEQIGLQNITRLSPQSRIAYNFQTHLIIQPDSEPPTLLRSGACNDQEASASNAINLEYTICIASASQDQDLTCNVLFNPRLVAEE